MLELNDFLQKASLEPAKTVVMRHRPTEKSLREALPWLIEDNHDLFVAFQSQHGPSVERILKKASFLASFISDGPGRALFVGIYIVHSFRQITAQQFWAMRGNRELKNYGTHGPRPGQRPLWFDLRLAPELSEFRGKLAINWPRPERSWVRWASRNKFSIHAIHEESALYRAMSSWDQLILSWNELRALPNRWKQDLAQWRGIYYIRDCASGKGYVGSAYGVENIWGRWSHYAATGHGGNRLLRGIKPENLSFSILQRVSPDLPARDVIAIENSWKLRLQTRAPLGLNHI